MARVRKLAGRSIAQYSSPNVGGRMSGHRGIVLHIAEGYFQGSIAWQMNGDQRYADGTRVTTSSTWIVGREPGEWAQMVDSDTIAWAQRDGSRAWLSIELVGFTRGHSLNPGGWEKPTAWQIEACAQLLAWCHRQHGIPLQVASSPTGRGLGHHSMGAPAWGHSQCPGQPVIDAKQQIVNRAKEIVGGGMNLNARNKSFIVESDGSTPDTNSVGHQWARTHQYAHRLVSALLWGSPRYAVLDTVAYPGTEEKPAPTSSSDPDRRGASWRYALQRIWRWSYWGYRRTVRIEEQLARMEAAQAAHGELLAQIAAAVGVGDRQELVEQIAQRAAEIVGQRSAADIARYLEIVAVDEDEGPSSGADES